MNGYTGMDQRTGAARREATWNAIASDRYLAPARIAMDEARERALTEAAHSRLLASGAHSHRRSSDDLARWFPPAWVMRLRRWMKGARSVDAATRLGTASPAVPHLP